MFSKLAVFPKPVLVLAHQTPIFKQEMTSGLWQYRTGAFEIPVGTLDPFVALTEARSFRFVDRPYGSFNYKSIRASATLGVKGSAVFKLILVEPFLHCSP